jgi:hypothetical protein
MKNNGINEDMSLLTKMGAVYEIMKKQYKCVGVIIFNITIEKCRGGLK